MTQTIKETHQPYAGRWERDEGDYVYDWSDQHSKVREIIKTSSEIEESLPADYHFNTIYVQVPVKKEGKFNHKEIFLNGYDHLLRKGYDIDIHQLVQIYNDWFENYNHRVYTKSEANRSWKNELGEQLIDNMKMSFYWKVDSYIDEIEEKKREQRRLEEESKPNDFDRLGDLQMETLTKEVA